MSSTVEEAKFATSSRLSFVASSPVGPERPVAKIDCAPVAVTASTRLSSNNVM
jgi:hypothetical protein